MDMPDRPPRLTFVGDQNTGKSSLINSLKAKNLSNKTHAQRSAAHERRRPPGRAPQTHRCATSMPQ